MGDKSLLRRVVREFEAEVLAEVQDQLIQAHDRIGSLSTLSEVMLNKGRLDGMAELWQFLKDLSEYDEDAQE